MKALIALFGFKKKTKTQKAFSKYMKLARVMVNIARNNHDEGFHLAAKAALDSAKAYRQAAHATMYYGSH